VTSGKNSKKIVNTVTAQDRRSCDKMTKSAAVPTHANHGEMAR
jgi:hypothetical protein